MKRPAVSIDLPAGWSGWTDVGPLAVIAKAVAWAGDFVPNLTLAFTQAEPGQTLDAYLATQLRGVAGSLGEPVLLDAAIEHALGAVSFLVAHAGTGVDVTMLQHHRFVHDGWVVASCVTAADHDWPSVEIELRGLVRSARCHP